MDVKDIDKWDILAQKIKQKLNFNCDEYSKNFLMRRAEVRLRSRNLDSYLDYAKILDTDVQEQEKLMKELTIHVTHFFRDIDFYQAFMDEIIPELTKHKTNITIWSAGCSSGEEPYSLVICFKEKLGESLNGIKLRIIANDYDQATIDRAKEGLYEELQFKEIPKEYKDKYFNKEGDTYRIKSEIKKYVEFSTADILREKPKNVDIIVCRNTVIYFEAETKSKLYVDFYDSVTNQGYFILGKTETINGPAREKFKVFNARERIYKKE